MHYERQLAGVTANLCEQHRLETNSFNGRVNSLEGQVQQGVEHVAELERKLSEARHYQKLEDKNEWEKIVNQSERRNTDLREDYNNLKQRLDLQSSAIRGSKDEQNLLIGNLQYKIDQLNILLQRQMKSR